MSVSQGGGLGVKASCMDTRVEALGAAVQIFKGAGSTAEACEWPNERFHTLCFTPIVVKDLYSRGKCSISRGGAEGIQGITRVRTTHPLITQPDPVTCQVGYIDKTCPNPLGILGRVGWVFTLNILPKSCEYHMYYIELFLRSVL